MYNEGCSTQFDTKIIQITSKVVVLIATATLIRGKMTSTIRANYILGCTRQVPTRMDSHSLSSLWGPK